MNSLKKALTKLNFLVSKQIFLNFIEILKTVFSNLLLLNK